MNWCYGDAALPTKPMVPHLLMDWQLLDLATHGTAMVGNYNIDQRHWKNMARTTEGNTSIVFNLRIIFKIIYTILVRTTTGNNYVISSTNLSIFYFYIEQVIVTLFK